MRLSVGTRWTLRYSLAMLATVVVFAMIVFDRVEQRFQQNAELLLDLQVTEVRAALERHLDEPQALDGWLDQKLAGVGESLSLGVALLDASGVPMLERGIFEAYPFALSPEIALAVQEEGFHASPLGERYDHFVTTAPFRDGVLVVAISGRHFLRRTHRIARLFQIAVPTMLVLTLGFGWWLTRRSLEPISEITETAQRITGSHMEEWIPTVGTRDELDRLAETLNSMLARVRGGMERSREFQTRLARELRAPLLGLQREIAALAQDEKLSDFGRLRLERALEEAEALAEAVHAMLRLAWSDSGRAAASLPVPLATLVEGAAHNVAPAAERRQVALTLGPLVSGTVRGDPFWLHQLFDSVLEAAVASLPGGGTVSVWSGASETEGRCLVSMRARPGSPGGVVTKGDPGISSSARLALAREIARAHGGQLMAEATEAGDLDYRLDLPA
ncbi:MAG: HAMP domain-containing sensor histidine kinase [Myxococcota bacterium]